MSNLMTDCVRIPCGLFGGVPIKVWIDAIGKNASQDDINAVPDAAAAALEAFMRLDGKDLLDASRHAYAYYRDFHQSCDGEKYLDEYIGVPETVEDIWRFVEPRYISIVHHQISNEWYIILCAECAWEQEHGFSMSWRNGRDLVKVSEDDILPVNEADLNGRVPIYFGWAWQTYSDESLDSQQLLKSS